MTPFATVVRRVEEHGLDLVRAHPGPDRLHLELRDDAGRRVVGQWVPDPQQATRVAAQTARTGPVEAFGELVLQHAGADRRLVVLAALVAEGAELVVHRPERRAVVRTVAGEWTKVVRASRTGDLVRRMGAAHAVPGITVPEVTAWDDTAGTIALSTLPGVTLHDLLTTGVPAQVAARLGRAIRRLHDAGADPDGATATSGAPAHDLAAEVDVTRGLLDLARTHGALDALEVAAVERQVATAAARVATVARPTTPALLHRDLHDKQLLVDGEEAGMLDVDTLGDPGLDLGNLLAHLDLRVWQGWATREVASRVEQGVVAGYAPDGRTLAAAQGYRALTAAKLRALYAFRPGDRPPSS